MASRKSRRKMDLEKEIYDVHKWSDEELERAAALLVGRIRDGSRSSTENRLMLSLVVQEAENRLQTRGARKDRTL